LFRKWSESRRSIPHTPISREIFDGVTHLFSTGMVGTLFRDSINPENAGERAELEKQMYCQISRLSTIFHSALCSVEIEAPFAKPSLIKRMGMDGVRDNVLALVIETPGSITRPQAELALEYKLAHPELTYAQVKDRLRLVAYDTRVHELVGSLLRTTIDGMHLGETDRDGVIETLQNGMPQESIWSGFENPADQERASMLARGSVRHELRDLISQIAGTGDAEQRVNITDQLRQFLNRQCTELENLYCRKESEVAGVEPHLRNQPIEGRQDLIEQLVLMERQGLSGLTPEQAADMIERRRKNPDRTYAEIRDRMENTPAKVFGRFLKDPVGATREAIERASIARRARRDVEERFRMPETRMLPPASPETLEHVRLQEEEAARRQQELARRQAYVEEASRRNAEAEEANARALLRMYQDRAWRRTMERMLPEPTPESLAKSRRWSEAFGPEPGRITGVSTGFSLRRASEEDAEAWRQVQRPKPEEAERRRLMAETAINAEDVKSRTALAEMAEEADRLTAAIHARRMVEELMKPPAIGLLTAGDERTRELMRESGPEPLLRTNVSPSGFALRQADESALARHARESAERLTALRRQTEDAERAGKARETERKTAEDYVRERMHEGLGRKKLGTPDERTDQWIRESGEDPGLRTRIPVVEPITASRERLEELGRRAERIQAEAREREARRRQEELDGFRRSALEVQKKARQLQEDEFLAGERRKPRLDFSGNQSAAVRALNQEGLSAMDAKRWGNLESAFGRRGRIPKEQYETLMEALDKAGIDYSVQGGLVMPESIRTRLQEAEATAATTRTQTNGPARKPGGGTVKQEPEEEKIPPEIHACYDKMRDALKEFKEITPEEIITRLREVDSENSERYYKQRKVDLVMTYPTYLRDRVYEGTHGIYAGILLSHQLRNNQPELGSLRDRLDEAITWFGQEATLNRRTIPYLASLSILSNALALTSDQFNGLSDRCREIAESRLTEHSDRRLYYQLEEAYTGLVPGLAYKRPERKPRPEEVARQRAAEAYVRERLSAGLERRLLGASGRETEQWMKEAGEDPGRRVRIQIVRPVIPETPTAGDTSLREARVTAAREREEARRQDELMEFERRALERTARLQAAAAPAEAINTSRWDSFAAAIRDTSLQNLGRQFEIQQSILLNATRPISHLRGQNLGDLTETAVAQGLEVTKTMIMLYQQPDMADHYEPHARAFIRDFSSRIGNLTGEDVAGLAREVAVATKLTDMGQESLENTALHLFELEEKIPAGMRETYGKLRKAYADSASTILQ
jgi:hypothetical protein